LNQKLAARDKGIGKAMKVERVYSLNRTWAKHPSSIVLYFVKPAKQTDPKKQRPISLPYIYPHAER